MAVKDDARKRESVRRRVRRDFMEKKSDARVILLTGRTLLAD
jgi:hypothetical protein